MKNILILIKTNSEVIRILFNLSSNFNQLHYKVTLLDTLI